MSKRGKKASGMVSGKRKSSSVFDFLYHDGRRVGSFLSQFNPHGVPIENRQSESSSRSQTNAGETSGGVDFYVANANRTVGDTTSAEGSESAELVYDPLWANARELLDYLHTEGLINRNIDDANIGEFVLCKGELAIIDSTPIQTFYRHPTARDIAMKNAADRGILQSEAESKLELDFLDAMHRQIQAHLSFSGKTVWSTLRPDGLITPPNELMMKYGAIIDGEWAMLD